MSESSQKQQPNQPRDQQKGQSKNQPKGQSAESQSPVMRPAPKQGPKAKRERSKRQREEQQQRMIRMVTGVTLGVALLVLLIGIVYDKVWVPSEAVAQVNGTTLSRKDYWQQQRYLLAEQIIQNFQMLALFGDQDFAEQFAGRGPGLNQQVDAIKTQPIDSQFISQWQDGELVAQGAAALSIEMSDGEVTQAIAAELGQVFAPITPTVELTPTEVLEVPTLMATPMTTPTLAPTVTPGGPTLTPSATATPLPSSTPPPTSTPFPTPLPAVASQQTNDVVAEVYKRFVVELELVDITPKLTQDDFSAALHRRYRQQLLERRIQESLVPSDTFTVTTTPDRIQARQIFLAVEVAPDAPDEEREKAFETRQGDAEKVLKELRGGKDFARLAEEYSDDPGSKDQGGDVGYFDNEGALESGEHLHPAFVEAAFALEDDDISDVVRTPFGWHIIQVTDRQIPTEDQQLRTARTDAFKTWLEKQREQATVKQFPEPTATVTTVPTEEVPTPMPTYLPGPPTPMPTPIPTPPGNDITPFESP